MNDAKYIGLDVHQATISAALLDSSGKLVMESVLETKAATILQFVHGLRGSLWVTFEEGTWAAWLYDLLKPHVSKIVVCDPRRNALLKERNKSDRIDARKLAELLRGGLLRPVYHGETGLRTLRELARSYLTISKDLTRVMNRGIPCAGTQVHECGVVHPIAHRVPIKPRLLDLLAHSYAPLNQLRQLSPISPDNAPRLSILIQDRYLVCVLQDLRLPEVIKICAGEPQRFALVPRIVIKPGEDRINALERFIGFERF